MSTLDPKVCPIPEPNLLTLIIFLVLYKFKTLTISFPILSDDPMETVLGISETNKSSI